MLYFAHMTNNSKYQINEKDIDSALRFLKITDPKNATPETAIDLLEYLQASFHTMNHENPENLIKLYEEFKKNKN